MGGPGPAACLQAVTEKEYATLPAFVQNQVPLDLVVGVVDALREATMRLFEDHFGPQDVEITMQQLE